MNDMRKLMESIQKINEAGRNAAFAIYTSEDGNGRFPGWTHIKGIVVVQDQNSYMGNKRAAIEAAVEKGILSDGSRGFASAYQIEDGEIIALRNVVAQLEEL
jgi:hypothetical protein